MKVEIITREELKELVVAEVQKRISERVIAEVQARVSEITNIMIERINKQVIKVQNHHIISDDDDIKVLFAGEKTLNALRGNNINTVGHLLSLSKDDLFKLRRVGYGTYNAIIDKLEQHGLELRGSFEVVEAK